MTVLLGLDLGGTNTKCPVVEANGGESIEIVPAALGPVAGAVGAALWAAEAP